MIALVNSTTVVVKINTGPVKSRSGTHIQQNWFLYTHQYNTPYFDSACVRVNASGAVCLAASNDGDAGNPGVWWKIPTSYMTPDSCSRRCGVAKVCGDEDEEAEGRRQQRCERQKEEDLSFRDSCQEDILLEVYNTADMDTGMSIDGFEAERLGVLRIKLSDIWTQGISSQPAAGRIRAGSQPGAGEPRAGHADSTTMPAGYSDATLHACEAGEAETQQCRTDRWLGGIVSPSCSRQHNGSASADSGIPASDQYIVEARLEASWGGCTCGR